MSGMSEVSLSFTSVGLKREGDDRYQLIRKTVELGMNRVIFVVLLALRPAVDLVETPFHFEELYTRATQLEDLSSARLTR